MKVSLPQRNKLAQSMLWNLFLLTVGAVFFSLGAQAVAAHHGFLTGGIFGAGLLGWYTTGLFTPAIWYLLINIPLFFVSWFQIGRQFRPGQSSGHARLISHLHLFCSREAV